MGNEFVEALQKMESEFTRVLGVITQGLEQPGGGTPITPAGGGGGSFGPFQIIVNQANDATAKMAELFQDMATDINAALATIGQTGGAEGGGGGITPAGGAGGSFGPFQTLVNQSQEAFDKIVTNAAAGGQQTATAFSSGLSGEGGGETGGGITPTGGAGGSFGPFQTLVDQGQQAFQDLVTNAATGGQDTAQAFASGLTGAGGGETGGGITPTGGPGGSFGAFQTLVNQAQTAFENLVTQAATGGQNTSQAFASGLSGAGGGETGGGITPAGGAGGSFGPFQTLVNMAQEAFTNIIGQAGPIGGQISAALSSGFQQGGEGGQPGGGITPAGGAGGSFGPFQTLVNMSQGAFANIVAQSGPVGGQISAAIVSGLQQGGEGGQAGGGITPAGGAGGSFGPFQTLVNMAQEAFTKLGEMVVTFASTQLGAINSAITGVANTFTQQAQTMVTALESVGNASQALVGQIGQLDQAIGGTASTFTQQAQIMVTAIQSVGNAVQALIGQIGQIDQAIGGTASTFTQQAQTMTGAIQSVGSAVQGLIGQIGQINQAIGGAAGTVSQQAQVMIQALNAVAQAAAAAAQQMAAMGQGMGGGIGGTGYAQPYGANPYYQQFGFASGFGPKVVDHPMQMTVGESGSEMVYVAPMNNNRNSHTGELSPFAPMRARFQAGIPGAAGGFGGGRGPASFAQMFYQISQSAILASKVSQQSMQQIGDSVEEQAVPAVQTLGNTFEATGQQSSNALLQVGQMINAGLIPPIQGVGIATIDASALVGQSTQQMTSSFEQPANYVQGAFIPLIGQGIPSASNAAAQGIRAASGNMNNALGQVGQYLLGQFIPAINPQIPNASNTAAQAVGSATNFMGSSFDQTNQSVQGLVGSINQIPQAAAAAGSALQQLQQLQQAVGGGQGAAYQSLTAPGAFPQGPIPAGWNDPSNPLIQLGQQLMGGAAGIGPAVFNSPTRLTVGESGKEMVYTSRMQAGTIGGGAPLVGGGGGGEFAKMFTQAGDAAKAAGEITNKSMRQIGTSIEQEAVPAVQTLGRTFTTTGQQSSNAMLEVGKMINSGVIPPIEGIGIATIDATNLVGPSTQQMTTAFGATAQFVAGSFIPTIAPEIPNAGNNAAEGIGAAANYMGQSFDAVGQSVGNLINGINQIPAAAQGAAGAMQGQGLIGAGGGNALGTINAPGAFPQGPIPKAERVGMIQAILLFN